MPITHDQLNKIVALASEHFVRAHEIKKQMGSKLQNFFTEHPGQNLSEIYFNGDSFSEQPKPGFKLMTGFSFNKKVYMGYPHFKDDRFTTDANVITERYIASKGPDFTKSLDEFFKNTVFNPSFQINKIIALGDKMTLPKAFLDQDFYDYCIQPRTNEKTEHYTFSVDNESKSENYTKDGTRNCLNLKTILTSKLKILENDSKDTREVAVHVLPVTNGSAINLDNDADHSVKEFLWQLMLSPDKGHTVVHCKGGQGRTGSFIFQSELVKNGEAIFEEKSAEIAAQKCIEIFNHLRKERFCLVEGPMQFVAAIKNAASLYQFGLQKNYITKLNPALGVFGKTTASIPEPIKEAPFKPWGLEL